MSGRKGRSGRRPLPTALKKARGTYRKDRSPAAKAGKAELAFPPAKLAAPAWLDKTAKAEWAKVVPQLDLVQVLTEPDLLQLAAYCAAASLWIQATKQYQREGRTVKSPGGVLRQHPMIRVAQEARAQALRFAIEFGLTPAARSRIAAGDPPAPPRPPPTSTPVDDGFPFNPPDLKVIK